MLGITGMAARDGPVFQCFLAVEFRLFPFDSLKSALLLGCMFLRQFRLFPLIVVFKSVDLVGDALVGVLEQGFLARKVRLGPFPFQDVEQISVCRLAFQAGDGGHAITAESSGHWTCVSR
jgi:hypothetical protein